jgi:uncharacterized protein (TIGR00369 family)
VSEKQTRRQLVEAFLPHSPHTAALGITIESIDDDHAVLTMPFKDELATIGDLVHGGAVSTLIDTAAMAAAWASDEVPESPTGSTVSLTVNFASGARGVDLRAEARVFRRGRQLCSIEVHATDPDGKPVAHGIATYRFG